MPESRLVHTPLKIGQLIQDYRSGKIVIPEFQREYVWKKSKASRLVDSLYRGFPISSLLLWTSTEYTQTRHHILPKAQFPERQQARADCIANIACITGSANRSVGASAPDVYLAKLPRTVLESQCIPTDESLWRIDRAKELWAARRALLAEAFNEHLRSALPSRRIEVQES